MNTSGEKVPSCRRSEGSPSSESEVSSEPSHIPGFLGLMFLEPSWYQPATETGSAPDPGLACPSSLPERRHSRRPWGRPRWLLLLLPLPAPACLPGFPSCSLSVQALGWFVAPPPRAGAALLPQALPAHANSPHVLSPRVKAAWDLCPVPSPVRSTRARVDVREVGLPRPHLS